MKYNQITWYSKLAAILVFLLVVPVLSFYIGAQYQQTKDLYPNEEGKTSGVTSGKNTSTATTKGKLAPALQKLSLTSVSPAVTVSGSVLTVQGRGFTNVSRLSFYQNGILLGWISNPTQVSSDGVALKFLFTQDFYTQSLKAKPGVYQIAVANNTEVSNKVNLTVK